MDSLSYYPKSPTVFRAITQGATGAGQPFQHNSVAGEGSSSDSTDWLADRASLGTEAPNSELMPSKFAMQAQIAATAKEKVRPMRDSYVPEGVAVREAATMALGGGQGADAVKWAETQLGVSEKKNPKTVKGYSGGAWQPWCADFVSTAYKKSGGSPFGHLSSVKQILTWGKEQDRFTSAKTAAEDPSSLRLGDIAVWKSGGKSHVGLVSGVNDDGTFNTIEGNSDDKVARRTHPFQGGGLLGFVRASPLAGDEEVTPPNRGVAKVAMLPTLPLPNGLAGMSTHRAFP